MARATAVKTELRSKPGGPTAAFAHRLAAALGWEEGSNQLRGLQIPGVSLSVTEARIAEEPAVLFVGHQSAHSSDLLNTAGRLAYHLSIEWGVLSNRRETIVFNSHRVHDGQFLRAVSARQGSSRAVSSLFDLLEPERVLDGSLEHSVEGKKADYYLAPIDDALVAALDRLRDEAMRHANWSHGIDEVVHELFSQAFVLRAIEDRKLDNRVPPLHSAVRRDRTLDADQFRAIQQAARDHVQSDLFAHDALRDLAPDTIVQLIEELYEPPHLRAISARYNFQWVSADVLGRAYEKYLSSILEPRPLRREQSRLFDEPLRDVKRRTVRHASGVYYTPRFIVKHLIGRSMAEFRESSPDAGLPRVADISCGSGSFLTAALDALKEDSTTVYGHPLRFRDLIERGSVFGVDIDTRAVMLSRLSLWLKLAEEPEPLPLPQLNRHVIHADSLSAATWQSTQRRFDIVVGNPPFVAFESIKNRAQLTKGYDTASGRFDLAYVFIERCIMQLKSGGVLAMVVPNRMFGNRDATLVREVFLREMTLRSVVDFGSLEVFAGVSAYTGLICATKEKVAPHPVRVVRVDDLPERFQGAFLSIATSGERCPGMRSFLSDQPRDRSPWQWMSSNERTKRLRLEDRSILLSDIAETYQGIKTGANAIFILDVEQALPGIATVRNKLGEVFEIETDLLRPVVFGSTIRSYLLPADPQYILYPYGIDGALTVETLKQAYPRTFKYLDSHESALSQRSSIEQSGRQWYELIRERDKTWLEAPKLMMRDLAPALAFAPDPVGEVYLVGGSAVVPADDAHLWPLLAFLNSSLATWQMRFEAPAFRGSFFKVEPQHLQRLQVPEALLSEPDIRDELTRAAQDIAAATAQGLEGEARALQVNIDGLFQTLAG